MRVEIKGEEVTFILRSKEDRAAFHDLVATRIAKPGVFIRDIYLGFTGERSYEIAHDWTFTDPVVCDDARDALASLLEIGDNVELLTRVAKALGGSK